ncbi:MAG TPA: MFS transporter [Micropepsaceae bacterium]|nr:MFS transporter [Micropepsaceae bacterium]
MAKTVDVAEIIGSQRFGAFQLRIVILCGLVQFLDGFDTQALAYAAPALRAAWHLAPQELGPVFGFGAFGTGIGSVVLSPLADIFGRKKIIITAVTLFGLLSLCTVVLTSVDQLLILRPLTGFGLGAALPLTFVMANEFAPARIRARMIAAMACGFAVGAASGGLLQAEMLPYFGWQGIFFIGGVLPLILAAVLLLFLPESVRFLAAKTGRSHEIAAILRKAEPARSFPPDTEFVLAAEPKNKGFRPTQLFTEGRAVTTMLLWLVFLVTLASLNTLNNWLPLALNMAGLPEQQAVRLTTLFQFGGIAGVLLLGIFADRIGYPRVLILAFIGLAIFVAATGLMGDYVLGLAIVVAGTGFCLVGANNTLNAFATTLYPTEIRSTGAGWASSFGRFVGGFGPIIGGVLLHELPLRTVFFIFAMPAIGGALGVLALVRARQARASIVPAKADARA